MDMVTMDVVELFGLLGVTASVFTLVGHWAGYARREALQRRRDAMRRHPSAGDQ